MFENVDIHTYGRWRPAYPKSSPVSLGLRGAENADGIANSVHADQTASLGAV